MVILTVFSDHSSTVLFTRQLICYHRLSLHVCFYYPLHFSLDLFHRRSSYVVITPLFATLYFRRSLVCLFLFVFLLACIFYVRFALLLVVLFVCLFTFRFILPLHLLLCSPLLISLDCPLLFSLRNPFHSSHRLALHMSLQHGSFLTMHDLCMCIEVSHLVFRILSRYSIDRFSAWILPPTYIFP